MYHTGTAYSKMGGTRDLYKTECLSKFAFCFKSRFICIFTYGNNYISLNLALLY